jgi:hypothetical protein
MTDLTHAQHIATPAWMVLVDGAVDQICGSAAEAKREVRDLKKMDCGTVTMKAFATWAEAHAYEDKLAAR